MSALSLIAVFIGIPAAWLAVSATKQLAQRHLFSAGIRSASSLSLAAVALLSGSIGLNVFGYQRLTWEAPVAQLHVIQALDQGWLVSLKQPGLEPQEYVLQGDQWRLEAQVIKWKSWANLLGLDSQYRLERLSGRYADAEISRSQLGSAYDLKQDEAAIMDRIPAKWRPWVDSHFGSGAYLPLKAGQRYSVSISQSGLIARPML